MKNVAISIAYDGGDEISFKITELEFRDLIQEARHDSIATRKLKLLINTELNKPGNLESNEQ